MVGSSSSSKSGSANSAAAKATRMRQPPENSAQARCCSLESKPRPARIAAARAGAAWAAISARRVCTSAKRNGSCPISASARRRVRSSSAASTVSMRVSGPSGASWASRRTRARAASAMVPLSIAISPPMARNRLVLPAPFRPTRPTRAPVGIWTEARSTRSRPATRTQSSSIVNMLVSRFRSSPEFAARSDANFGFAALAL